MKHESKVRDYYEKSHLAYMLTYSPDYLHYGLWYNDTASFKESLENTNRKALRLLEIKETDTVLDAGCGVGGVSKFITQQTGAIVHGITLSPRQVRAAKKKTKHIQKTHFHIMDFHRTTFKENTFDKAFAIESVSHTPKSPEFLEEMYRILKPGGRIAIMDAWFRREPNTNEQPTVQEFFEGWTLGSIDTIDYFRKSMEHTGYENIRYIDLEKEATPHIDWVHRIGKRWHWLFRMLSKIGLMPEEATNTLKAGILQKDLAQMGFGTYGVFVGEKPKP